MDSNNKNYGEEQQQQLHGSARKRKFNELTNDGHGQPAAAEGEQKQLQLLDNLDKMHCCGQQGNNDLKNLHLESLTREELIQLVQKQMANQNETSKHLEAAKKEAKEMATKMAEMNMALLASQQKVERLTAEEHQNPLDSAKQADEKFSQHIVQLEEEKAEVHAELGKKLIEIEEMHKEVEEKSEQLAEKAKQIDALLIQLNESTSHQHQMPTEEEMKIQLSLETWFDWLAFVPRPGLGKIVPKIGDRRFASIVQPFLHEYRDMMIADIEIVAPYEEDPSGPHPRVRGWQNDSRRLKFKMAESQMPANIKTFNFLELSYFDQSVLNFMQKFQKNGLFDNVNLLSLEKVPARSKAIIQPVLCHILPLINDIFSIYLHTAQLPDFYDDGNSKEIYELNMKMMEKTRILWISNDNKPKNLHANTIDLYCRFLYQTARADGKPRVLQFGIILDYSAVYLFIDRIKQDFLMATDSATFFIQILLPKSFQLQEDIRFDNGKTNERLLAKIEVRKVREIWEEAFLLISRYPLASTKKWIEENEKEVMVYDLTEDKDRHICLTEELKIVAI